MSTRKNIPADHVTALRKALGLSMLDMARAVGVTGSDTNTIDHWEQTERGMRPISGSVGVVLRYMAQAVEAQSDAATVDLLGRALPRFLDCANLEDEDDGTTIVMHTRWPRFYGIAMDELPEDVPDALREAPPGIGERVSFLFNGLTDGGVPRFPVFLAVRDYE